MERISTGFQKMGDLVDRYKKKAEQPKKKPTTYPWQQLALDIMKDFNDEKHKSFYFRVCKMYPEPYIRMVWANTKEGCKHSNYGGYFAKMLKVYNDQNKGIYTPFESKGTK